MGKHRGPCACERVPCDRSPLKKGKGLASLGGRWDKTYRAVPCAVHPSWEKGVAWYLAETLTGRLLESVNLAMALTEQTAGLAGYVARIPRYAQGSIPSMDLACLRPKSGTRAYLYCTCRYGDVSRLLSPLANGTKIKRLKPETLGYTDMLVPPMKLQQRFEDAVNPTFGCIDVLMEQNERLRVARDRLLPKLMSGEIEV